jgi:hypothetical protein
LRNAGLVGLTGFNIGDWPQVAADKYQAQHGKENQVENQEMALS